MAPHAATVVWTGNRGEDTAGYDAYDRTYRIVVEGKPELEGSAHPRFRGSGDRHDPEELFLASLAGCHLLSYLSLCARAGVRVRACTISASGTLALRPDGGGRFDAVLLEAMVTLADPADRDRATVLHDAAHERCFIANSCNVPIRHAVGIVAEGVGAQAGDS